MTATLDHDRPSPPTDLARGLDSAEARRRLAVAGANELPSPGTRTLRAIVVGVFREPMFLLLVGAAALYLVVGDLAEGLALAFFATLSVGLVVFQEMRGEKALAALRDLAAPTARVRRDGADRVIPAREVVPGDVLVVEEGERVAADAVTREATALHVDESILTGEGMPVMKFPPRDGETAFADARFGGDDRPELYASTLVVAGHGLAEVVRTGAKTAVGAIGLSLASIDAGTSTLQAAIAGVVRLFLIFGILTSLGLVALIGFGSGDWVAGLLAGLALSMAMLPEEFPMALAIFVILGARRLARVQVLTRRPAIIETLGATSVLATDKTGTLTENRLRLAVIADGDGALLRLGAEPDVPTGALGHVLAVARRASRLDGFDPIDRALGAVGADDAPATLLADWPIAPGLLATSRLWREADGRLGVAAKGAPEAIARLCRLDESATAALKARVESLAGDGLRLLAVAEGRWEGDPPADQAAFSLTLVGLVGFVDPLRSTVPAAVAEARRAGIRVVMITGDHPSTALAIAREAGLDVSGGVLTGPEIAALDDEALAARVAHIQVFARIMPGEKLRLVQAFRAGGAVVAMTGDGVNDAPALEAAHVGLAIGPRATDVAKEASDIVLLDEDFGHIVAGVRLGRRIFDNLRKVMIYIAAIHVPIAGVALLPVLFGSPPILLPLHVVLTEMVIDPICSLAFEHEREEPGLMERPPRALHEPFVGVREIVWGMIQGLAILAACMGVEWVARDHGQDIDATRTLVFITLTAGNLALVQVDATRRLALVRLFRGGSATSWAITAAATATLAATILVPSLATLFRFTPPSVEAAILAILAGLAAPFLMDLSKLLPAARRRTA